MEHFSHPRGVLQTENPPTSLDPKIGFVVFVPDNDTDMFLFDVSQMPFAAAGVGGLFHNDGWDPIVSKFQRIQVCYILDGIYKFSMI